MTNSDLLFRMLNPKLNAMLRNSLDEFKELMTTRGDMNAVYICDAIKDLPLDASTYTAELIKQTCELHNVAPIILDTVQDNFDIMSKFTQDEVTITARNYRKLLSLGAVDKFKGMAGSDPLKFLELIKNYELVDSAEVEDPDIYRTVNFLDMDVKKVEEASGNVIPSCFSVVNDNTRGGYYTGQLVVFSGAPGCLLGDTKIMCIKSLDDPNDVEYINISELIDKPPRYVPSLNLDTNEYELHKYSEVIKTKEVTEYCEINYKSSKSSSSLMTLKCTLDHKIWVNNQWVPAIEVPIDGELSSIDRDQKFTVVSINKVTSNDPIPVYDIINAGPYHNFIANMITVKNSGKSLAMMNESVNMCRMGLKVKYTAIGDITEFDFMNRISGMVLDISMSSASLKQEYYYNILKEKHSYLSNLSLEFMAPDKFTVDDYISRLKVSGDYDNIDVFVIDYDTNFASRKTDSSYEKGDEIYNEVKVLASRPGKLVLMGAQPKIAYWSEEILELNSLSESSRKQQIIDMMITISHPATPNGANHVGIMNIAKNRRGSKGSCPYFLDKTGKMRNINKQDYDYFKIEEKPVTISRNPDGKSQSYNLGDAAREAQMSVDKANEALKDNNDAQPGFTIPGMTFN